MIRTLRIYFLGRLLREKVLLVGFIAIAAVIWLSSFSTRGGLFWRVQKVTTTQLAEQERWLGDQSKVQAAAQKAASQLKPEQTLDETRLFTTVQGLAREAGLRNITNQGRGPTLPSSGQFSFNTLKLTAEALDQDPLRNWDALKKFYHDLQEKSPYIAIDQFILQPRNRANPGQLTVFLTVSSVEVH